MPQDVVYCRIDLRLDERPLGGGATPTQFVERLVAALAGPVKELADRSPGAELVLKRALADDRREEIFVSRAALAGKVLGLPEAARALFAPLELLPRRAIPRPITLNDNDVVMLADEEPSGSVPVRRRAESPVIVVVNDVGSGDQGGSGAR